MPKPQPIIRSLRFLQTDEDVEMIERFDQGLQAFRGDGVFNPSFHFADVDLFAFRAVPRGGGPLTSYLSIGGQIVNLSKRLAESFDRPRFIDPKLFTLGEDVYVTVNTGHCPGGNDIFVMKVYPQLEPPVWVRYDERQPQERNWAFFEDDGQIQALYQLSPLKVLKLHDQVSGAWIMREAYQEPQEVPTYLTIGTQLHDGCLVCHRKIRRDGRKLYLGRLAYFEPLQRQVWLGEHWLAHSLNSLFGALPRRNENLFSCTYFSGLRVENGVARLSYGINDLLSGWATVPLAEL